MKLDFSDLGGGKIPTAGVAGAGAQLDFSDLEEGPTTPGGESLTPVEMVVPEVSDEVAREAGIADLDANISASLDDLRNTSFNIPDDIISMLEEGLITAGQARPLIGLNNASAIAEEIINKKLSARAVENMAKKNKVTGKTKNALDPNLMNEQKKIENNLGLKVKIVNSKKNSGKISIEYKNLDQFELVSNLLKKIY